MEAWERKDLDWSWPLLARKAKGEVGDETHCMAPFQPVKTPRASSNDCPSHSRTAATSQSWVNKSFLFALLVLPTSTPPTLGERPPSMSKGCAAQPGRPRRTTRKAASPGADGPLGADRRARPPQVTIEGKDESGCLRWGRRAGARRRWEGRQVKKRITST